MKFPILAAALALGLAAHAQTATPPDLADLVGGRGSSGETQLQARGYQQIRATRVDQQSWTFWWSEFQKQCVAVSTMDGRYASIATVPASNCIGGAGSAAAPVAPPPAAAIVAQPPEPLVLVCFGEATRLTMENHTGYAWNNERHRYEPQNRLESTNERFQADLQIELRDGQGRIHLTGRMVPPLNSGGTNGWWPLSDLRVGSDSISGRYQLNAFNRPQFQIDRRTGSIVIDGLGDFRGRCEGGGGGAMRRF